MRWLTLGFLILTAGCASNRTNTLWSMALVGTGSAGAGYAAAPREESPAGHALLWAGIGAATMGAIGLFLFDEEKRSFALSQENEVLKRTLDGLTAKDSSSEKLVLDTASPFGKEIPSEYRSLIKPGRWSVYALNHWMMQGENTLIHQDKMVRLIPPELSPGNSVSSTEEKNETK